MVVRAKRMLVSVLSGMSKTSFAQPVGRSSPTNPECEDVEVVWVLETYYIVIVTNHDVRTDGRATHKQLGSIQEHRH